MRVEALFSHNSFTQSLICEQQMKLMNKAGFVIAILIVGFRHCTQINNIYVQSRIAFGHVHIFIK